MEGGSARRVPQETTARRDEPRCIAHRGFAGVAPENTLAAVRGACGVPADSGDRSGGTGAADVIEIDVLPAAGGEPVVFHDRTLGRLTDVPTGRRDQAVWETPLDTLRELSVLGTDQSVSTFAELMNAIPTGIAVNVELKHPGTGEPHRELDAGARIRGRERWTGLARRVASVLDDHDNAVLVSSSYEGALAATREVAPDLPLAYLFWNSVEGGIAITERYDCEAVHPSMDMVTGTALFNSGYTPTGPFADIDLVERAHDAGRAVNVWTITDWHQATQLHAAGVDGLITDYPRLSGPELEPTRTDSAPAAIVESSGTASGD